MSALSDSFAAARDAFIERLGARGFQLDDDCRTLAGNIEIAGRPVEHQISVGDGFPIAQPRVIAPQTDDEPSWHQEADGRLCLWAEEDASDLPWADADAVIDRTSQWHAANAAGWPGDSLDLDLERYWERDLKHLILYPDLGPLTGKTCKGRRRKPNIWTISEGRPHPKNRFFGAAVVDIGELERPVRSFDEIAARLGSDEGAALRAGIKQNRIKLLMVRYRRGPHEAAIGLVAQDRDPDKLVAARAAHEGESTLRLRAGMDAEALSEKSAAIVGVGAIGSLLAEMLARSGIGSLSLIDGDLITPGNCIRHVATREAVGRPKPKAVKDHLVGARIAAPDAITPFDGTLETAEQVERLFAGHDLVIDATGDGPATALICAAARILRRPSITVCLQRGGTVARVDRFPLGDGESHDDPLLPGGPTGEVREPGCGDPVSPAPPWACSAAAARAAAMAADLLAGRNTYPPTIIDELIRESDRPRIVGATP